MQITEEKYITLNRELRALKKELERSLIEQQTAAAEGDLRENEEYATARSNSERLLNRKLELENLLAEAIVVQTDRSPRITIGSTVEVLRLDKKGNPVGKARRFVLETEGDTVVKGVLGTESPLGKEILNGTSGVYFVHNNGGINYQVKKIIK